MSDLSNKNFITYFEMNRNDPSRSIEEYNKIISETNTQVIWFAFQQKFLNDVDFNKQKDFITQIKLKNPNLLLFGTTYQHSVSYETTDYITGTQYGYSHANLIADTTGGSSTILKDSNAMFQSWNIELESPVENVTEKAVAFVQSIDSETQITTKQPTGLTPTIIDWDGDTYKIGNYTWKNFAFDPKKYGITNYSKYQFQTSILTYPYQRRCWSDITLPSFQTLIKHSMQRMLDTGVDGLWVDNFFRNAGWLQSRNNLGWQAQNTSITEICNDIKILYPLAYIATWLPPSYLDNTPKYPFDFYVSTIKNNEIINNTPDDVAWNSIKDRYPNSTHVAIFDFGSHDKFPMWYFSQNILDYQQRKDFAISFLRKFTEFFKSKGIKFAYPIHGPGMCVKDPTQNSPCNVLSFGTYAIYDSLAPEFDTYNTIKELINPITKSSEAGIGPILVLGLLAGGLYLYLKNREKESSKYQYQINSFK